MDKLEIVKMKNKKLSELFMSYSPCSEFSVRTDHQLAPHYLYLPLTLCV